MLTIFTTIHFNLQTEEKQMMKYHIFSNITLSLTGRMKCKPKDEAVCQNFNLHSSLIIKTSTHPSLMPCNCPNYKC